MEGFQVPYFSATFWGSFSRIHKPHSYKSPCARKKHIKPLLLCSTSSCGPDRRPSHIHHPTSVCLETSSGWRPAQMLLWELVGNLNRFHSSRPAQPSTLSGHFAMSRQELVRRSLQTQRCLKINKSRIPTCFSCSNSFANKDQWTLLFGCVYDDFIHEFLRCFRNIINNLWMVVGVGDKCDGIKKHQFKRPLFRFACLVVEDH